MNRLLAILMLSGLAVGTALAEDAPAAAPAAPAAQQESRFSGSVFNALRNLSAMLPKKNGHSTDSRQGATMGIRGAETTTSSLNPYWKDDKLDDPLFQAEIKSYQEAQQLLEEGKLDAAETALNAFIQEHPSSDLLPNARFALGLAYSAKGDRAKGKDAMESFAKDYPQHPLTADARKVAEELH